MAKQDHMNHLPDSLETQLESVKTSGEGDGNCGSMQKLQSYMTLLKDCTKAVQNELSSCKFNNEQCEYLADKLRVAVQEARLFSEVFGAKFHGPCPSKDVTKWVEITKLLLTLAKHVEGFVQNCCKNKWIQAPMTLTNVSEYVSSLGVNVELCKISFAKEFGALSEECSGIQGPTFELGDIHNTEVEIVKFRAQSDLLSLSRKVRLGLPSFNGKTKNLASYFKDYQEMNLVQLLTTGGLMRKLYKYVTKANKQLGKGATGTVFKATWLGISVAEKTFDGPNNPHFFKEVEILAPLRHPNVMSMYCCIKTDRSSSIVMELMDGDLHGVMRRRVDDNGDSRPFPILESVDIIHQVAEGVNYLPNKRIVHRDLKSANILVKRVEAEEREL